MDRIDQIRDKLAASLNAEGKPKKGYSLRVAALRRELGRLELRSAAPMDTLNELAEVDMTPDTP